MDLLDSTGLKFLLGRQRLEDKIHLMRTMVRMTMMSLRRGVRRRWEFQLIMHVLKQMAGNQALFGLDSDEGGGRTDIEENFFRGPIALQVFNRKEAGAMRRTLQRAR